MGRIGGCACFRGNGGERGLGIVGEEDGLGNCSVLNSKSISEMRKNGSVISFFRISYEMGLYGHR